MQLLRFFFFVFLLMISLPGLAQNSNLLAKVAYENAEVAFESKNLKDGLNELAKVDALLGKITPKSQYLRLQLWAQATETNPEYVDTTLIHIHTYLDLATSFEVDEEKQLEVIRLMNKLEKTKAAYQAKIEAERECKEKIRKIETDVLVRDQSKISSITGFDWDKDVVKQLHDANRIKGGLSKYKTSWAGIYIHKGEYYQLNSPGTLYLDISAKKKSYYIKGIEQDIDHQSYATTASGIVQHYSATLTVPFNTAPLVINALSDQLGFSPDTAYLVPESKTPMTIWYWWFQDYTIHLMGFPISTNYHYTLVIDRHFPTEAKLSGYKAPFLKCQ